jgi:diguanylate cyclase (GGDEF)-like protein/PAS domain S-box-containing protein
VGDRQWTRDDLAVFARGRQLTARNLLAAEVDPPAWLLAHSDGRWPFDSQAAIDVTHPDDRGGLVESFLASRIAPGEPVTVRLRRNYGGHWHHTETTWLNLLDHDDVGALVAFVREIDGPPVESPADENVGDYDPTRWMIWTIDDTGTLESVEGASLELLGYPPDELVGRNATELMPADTIADGVAMWVDLHLGETGTATSRRPWLRRDGSRIWMELSLLTRTDASGAKSVLVVAWDATQRMEQDRQLQALARDFKLLADEVPAGVFRCDPRGVVLFHNARWAELLDSHHGVTRIHDVIDASGHAILDEALAELAGTDSDLRRSLELTSHDGRRTLQVSLRAMGDGDGSSLIGSIEDVSETVQFRQAARHDALTGLLNRPALEEHLGTVLAADPAGTLVFFVDLDGFKAVNDTYGHDAGDAVLTEVARRLGAGLRPGDVVGRYGGDEFVVVCQDAASASPSAIIHRVAVALAGPIAVAGGSWSPRASIGQARGLPGDDAAAVLRRADLEMFEHKRRRIGRVSRGPS